MCKQPSGAVRWHVVVQAIKFLRGIVMLQLLYVETHQRNLQNDLLLFTLFKSDREDNKYRSCIYSTTERKARKLYSPWVVHSYFVLVIVFTFDGFCQTLKSIFVNCWVSFGTCSYRHKISKHRLYLQNCTPVNSPLWCSYTMFIVQDYLSHQRVMLHLLWWTWNEIDLKSGKLERWLQPS